MKQNEQTITREELYSQVWSKPMTTLAKEYGISDVGLKKICNKLKVPVPGLGYWQKIRNGQKIKQTPLPKIDEARDITSYTIDRNIQQSQQRPKQIEINDEEIKALIEKEQLPENKIRVPRRLDSPHVFVIRTEKRSKNQRADFNGLLELGVSGCLPVRVSTRNVSRAMRIMDTLIKELEKRDFKVVLSMKYGEKTHVSLLGEKIEFRLSEHYTRKEIELTKEEEIERDLKDDYWRDKYTYTPSGILRFNIGDSYGTNGIKTEWKDGLRSNLEEQLNSIIIGFIRMAYKERQWRIEKVRREREWQEERRRIEERQRLREEEEKRVNFLMERVDLWVRSRQIREYIQVFETSYKKRFGQVEPGSRVDKWLKWAMSCADRMDPLSPENCEEQINMTLAIKQE